MEIVSNIALISINETMIVQLVSFLILVFVMNRIMFRPLRRIGVDRRGLIDRIQQDIGRAEQELKSVTAEARKKEAAVKEQVFQIKSRLEESAHNEAGAVLKATGKEMEAIRHKTEADVAKMIKAAKGNLAVEAERLTVSIMEKMLDRRLVS